MAVLYVSAQDYSTSEVHLYCIYCMYIHCIYRQRESVLKIKDLKNMNLKSWLIFMVSGLHDYMTSCSSVLVITNQLRQTSTKNNNPSGILMGNDLFGEPVSNSVPHSCTTEVVFKWADFINTIWLWRKEGRERDGQERKKRFLQRILFSLGPCSVY